jgi:hypothetical protein
VCGLLLLSGSAFLGATTYVVDRMTDTNPSGGGTGTQLTGDLRYAIVQAQAGDAIQISASGTIALEASLPTLTRSICVQGPGAGLLTVRGAGGTVFSISAGATVTLSGVTISGGQGHGAGIFNQGTLTLNHVLVSGNTSGDPTNGDGTGGGIWNYVGATLTLNGTTLSGNSVVGNLSYAPSRGGGLANDGTATLKNSTVAGNSAVQGFGGGIWNSADTGTLTIDHCTISGNSSEGVRGGGIDNRGVLTARNSIVAGNSEDDLSGSVTSQGHNVFGATSGGVFDPTDLVGVAPQLGPLQDNGGSTPTMSPLPGSPAIDQVPGTPGLEFLAVDQRGISRPQGGLADSGAVEVGGSAAIRGRRARMERDFAARVFGAVETSLSDRSPILRTDPGHSPRALGTRGPDNPIDPCTPP